MVAEYFEVRNPPDVLFSRTLNTDWAPLKNESGRVIGRVKIKDGRIVGEMASAGPVDMADYSPAEYVPVPREQLRYDAAIVPASEEERIATWFCYHPNAVNDTVRNATNAANVGNIRQRIEFRYEGAPDSMLIEPDLAKVRLWRD